MNKAGVIKQSFVDHGISVREWARMRGFSEALVYAMLSGKTRGVRGESYQIALALGLREPPSSAIEPLPIQEVLKARGCGVLCHRSN